MKRSFKNKAWKVFSEFIRRRDADLQGLVSCISCGKVDFWQKMDAGHYIPKSVSLALRFHEKNVHSQCTACNRFRHGNLTMYALALKKRYGDDILESLDRIKREGEGTKLYESHYREIFTRYKDLING